MSGIADPFHFVVGRELINAPGEHLLSPKGTDNHLRTACREGPKPVLVDSSGHSESYDGVNVKPSSIQPVTPPIIIFTGKPSRARRSAALLAPLQCGPAQ